MLVYDYGNMRAKHNPTTEGEDGAAVKAPDRRGGQSDIKPTIAHAKKSKTRSRMVRFLASRWGLLISISLAGQPRGWVAS
jgi:hypothetical protein